MESEISCPCHAELTWTVVSADTLNCEKDKNWTSRKVMAGGPYYKLQEEADLGQERREMFLELMASYHSLPSLADKPLKCLGFGHIETRTEDPHSDLWQVEIRIKGYDGLPRTLLFS